MLVSTVFLSLLHAVALVNGAYTPRSRNIQARHAAILHARAPMPDPAPALVHPIKKRDSKKCRARPSSSSVSAPTSSPVAPVNPGADPSPTTSSKTQVEVTTHQPSPSTTEQPHTTVHKAPPPTPTTTQQKPTSSPSSGGGGGGGSDPFGGFASGTHTGQLTFYELGLTACGESFSDSDMVAAVSHSLFDAVPGANGNPNDNPICGKKAKVTYQGKSIVVSLVDRCTACAEFDLDLSPSAFSQLASQSLGRLSGATWFFD